MAKTVFPHYGFFQLIEKSTFPTHRRVRVTPWRFVTWSIEALLLLQFVLLLVLSFLSHILSFGIEG